MNEKNISINGFVYFRKVLQPNATTIVLMETNDVRGVVVVATVHVFFVRFVLFSWFLPISTNFVGRIEANEYNKWKMNEKNSVPSFSICLRLSGCDVLLLLLLVSFFCLHTYRN